MENTLQCDCGQNAVLKKFNTFSYHYCVKCKKEVAERPQLKINHLKNALDNLADYSYMTATQASPVNLGLIGGTPSPSLQRGPNTLAYKGYDNIACPDCNAFVCHLVADLTDDYFERDVKNHLGGLANIQCKCGRYTDCVKRDPTSKRKLFYIQGKGWV